MLTGKKIYLRPITADDATDEYVAWLNDREVNQFLESRFVLATKENVRKFIVATIESDQNAFFAICENTSNRHVGNIKLGPISKHHSRGDIGLFIGDKSCWGKGYGREAIQLISNYAFEKLGLHKVTAGCYGNNLGSAKAFLSSGFEQEGLFKEHCMSADGERVDVMYFAKLNTFQPNNS